MTTLFCFISLDTLLGTFFVVVLSVNLGVFLHLLASRQGFLHHVMLQLVSLLTFSLSHS